MTSVYNRSTKSRTAKVTMCIILKRTAPSPSTVIVLLGIHVVEDTVSLTGLPLRQLGFRGPRAPAFSTLQAGPKITEMETGSDVQYVERNFQHGQICTESGTARFVSIYGPLDNSWFLTHLTIPITHRSLCADEEMFQPGSLWVQRHETPLVSDLSAVARPSLPVSRQEHKGYVLELKPCRKKTAHPH